MIKDKKILEIETVGSQDRPINEEDRKAFNGYFSKANRAKKGRASNTHTIISILTFWDI